MTSFDSKRAKCAVIYRSELDFMSRCILDCKHIETGGQLFGFWTRDCVPVVLFAIGPGPKANHQVTFFASSGKLSTRIKTRRPRTAA